MWALLPAVVVRFAGVVILSLFVLGLAGIVGVMLIGRRGARSLMAGMVTGPVLIFAALAVLLYSHWQGDHPRAAYAA